MLFRSKAYTDGAIGSANTQLKAYTDGQISYVASVNSTQNTNITTATNLAQNAYNQANTDYTTVVVSAGTYGGTTVVPVIVASANGRITSISNTSITAGATITDDTTSNATRYIMLGQSTSGSYTVANTSSSKLTYNPSTGTLTTVDLNTTSDIIFKENIQPIDLPINIINSINGVSFDWKNTGKKSYGVIAQQLQSILPELVSETENGLSVNYLPIIAILIEAVKEQQKQIDELKK